MKLTKSDFISYLESPLHLWSKTNGQVTQQEKSAYDQHLAKQGYEVEALAKEFLTKKVAREYPAGTTISFEEVLEDGNYQSRIDALVHDVVHNTYDLYEIKSSTTIHTEHKYDVTFQYLVGKNVIPIYKVYLVRVSNEYGKDGEIDINQLFVIEDMSEHIAKREAEVYELRHAAFGIKRLSVAPADDHCYKPDTCICPDLCFPNSCEYPIYDLNRGSKKQYRELLDASIYELQHIPDTFKLSYKQRLQCQSMRIGKAIIDHDAIQHELAQLQFPLYFLDYETYGPALPLHDGYKPYQPITFQYSLHVLHHPDDEELEHYEFLATDQHDPCPQLVESLLNHLGEQGTIIVWNKGFECGRNTEMGELCPQYCDQLKAINDRVYDLMDIFAQGLYVDYRFHGSASIKKVLPVLCPELSYKELEIGEGATAMTKWYEMVYGDMNEAKREKIRRDLLTYCKLDTLAMVEIWRKLTLVKSLSL